ncbi:aldehyde dehydrogenase [Bacillus thuringiensis]|uniref:aldehyde dehydrogenase n=1 Tax=Bacillus thuringiensis TaxID=1428 RepID=UPI0010ABAB6B|nr:aldehyde dehydrogenase [Bacillus thuringiensis]TKA00079.1 aldehyde dehydrogenase [Bacillus thuringiensis]
MNKIFINGEFIESNSNEFVDVINPATEEILGSVVLGDEIDVEKAIEGTIKAQRAWEKHTASHRANIVKELIPLMNNKKELIAETYALEQGKTYKSALGEVENSIKYIEYMTGFALKMEGEILSSEVNNELILLTKKPVGVTSSIIPWNATIYILMRKMIPALVSGCFIVVKPSEETPLSTFEIAKLIQKTNIPKGLVQIIPGSGHCVGQLLSKHPKIDLVSLTGSTGAGKAVMQAASQTIKKVNLELGGKAPVIVSKHADIEVAVKYIVEARIKNSGQVCTCPERIYVHESIAESFISKLQERMEKLVVGDPFHAETDLGAIINIKQLDHIQDIVNNIVKEGARIILGGKKVDRKGYFFEPTTLVDVTDQMNIMKEEIFGPVLPITTFKDFDEVIEKANDCVYGLSSYIFSTNYKEIMRATQELKFGEVYVNCEAAEAMNGYHAGWRQSGIGGADGKHGYEEYLNTTVSYLRY